MPYIGTSPSNGVRRVHTYTATASQTTFTGASSEGITLSYVDANYLDVFQNGVLLGSADYTSTSGTSVVLAQGASADDLIVIVVYDVFSVADTVSKTNGGSFDSGVTMSSTLDVTGATTLSSTLGVTGASTLTGALSAKGGAVFNEDSADVDFRVESNNDANCLFVDGANDKVGIGTNTPQGFLTINKNSSQADLPSIQLLDDSDSREVFITNQSGDLFMGTNGSSDDVVDSAIQITTNVVLVKTQNLERMRVDNSGNLMVGKNNTNSSVGGVLLKDGQSHLTRGGGQVCLFNRQGGDGAIVGFASADSTEGSVSISGSTTSYNAFSGSHWSRLTDNSKPTILKGTIIETIDEMMDWYQLTFTVPATDDTSEHSPKISIALEDGQSVGDTITYNHEGTDYQATIIQEGDNKHTKCKISDTADSTRVYGVFADWDNDDDTVNDMYVTAVGTHVVRVNQEETVSAGDLLVSNGDGTAKVQDDDIIRSKTIGKVLTNIKQETYDDGSYTVPCALYCG